MIKVICPDSREEAGKLVCLALIRSHSSSLVQRVPFDQLSEFIKTGSSNCNPYCFVLIDPLDCWTGPILSALRASPHKIIVFGALPPSLALFLGASLASITNDLVKSADCKPALSGHFSESAASVCYKASIGNRASPIKERPFLRYDLTDEWNNLGYGAISVNQDDPTIWALAQVSFVPEANLLAQVEINGEKFCSYAALWDINNVSILWFNRAVGPIDSQEWALVEHYLANYRLTELPCWPVLREIPYGYSAAVTMRLDCDEDVESSRLLWKAYREMEVPFSLALHTKVLTDSAHHSLPKEVLSNGGALLSHTSTHTPNWGGNYESAFWEGTNSARTILEITGYQVKYAVSPFHQTPSYARSALSDAGYHGCIGGIIRNDPDFLTARAGQVSGADEMFIGHSQQCMLHGDCVWRGEDEHAISKKAFNISKNGGAFFGYLDHPFSSRYQYGWGSENKRIEFHRTFLNYIRQTPKVLFCNQTDAMSFLTYRSRVKVNLIGNSFVVCAHINPTNLSLAIEYRGNVQEVVQTGLSL